jgi:hypothetical protein
MSADRLRRVNPRWKIGEIINGRLLCNKCDKDLPVDEFPLRNGTKNGYRPVCKECVREYNRSRRRRRNSRETS